MFPSTDATADCNHWCLWRSSTFRASRNKPASADCSIDLWCHIGRLVFSASVQQLSTKLNQIMISSADLAAKAPFAPIEITGGVLADEAMALFK